ncbi:structural maintenance of chromosomes protein 2-like [Amphibalanus amphitrite]|uniref:structural maintenance of chromosomes protein 2-like n=1 Tax=Amphibalanus amphitrite TaxID=1232801 RepID=UPI001C909858|nr:structural maintenance of chromosomes protein 2-like [Amphibalanus amphitrite]
MYVTSMLIDGFKSYGQRTEITGFDPLFNAITGLNGSGKSNILDGICFVLGITNLSHVRATNLQELVYKNGQAGITKATVSIKFDNTDKAESPLGYEQYDEITITRQVVVGGRNKYAINGVNVQNNRVQDLFRSVKLNVNNPHFLIMQGRITKVLNMKPPEILSMIEEAAGTRLYECKKQVAQKTIEKKDAKLKEINDILEEEINPTMNKLKEERSTYLEYQKVEREYEHLSKFCIAFKFVSAQESCKKAVTDEQEVQEGISTVRAQIEKGHTDIGTLEEQIVELQHQRDTETGGQLTALEGKLEEDVKVEAKALAAVKGIKDSVKAEEKKKKQLQKSLADDRTALQQKEAEMGQLKTVFDSLREADEQQAAALAAAQKRFQAISSGMFSGDDGEDATLAQQLMNAKTAIADSESARKQADMKLKHTRQELNKRRTAMKKTEAEYKRDSKQLETMEAEVARIEKAIGQLQYDEKQIAELEEERRALRQEINRVREKLDVLESRYPQLALDYRDPERDFDRRTVRGVVGKLFNLKDVNTATALEVTAGGRLYNVVVDTEVVGKKLLERGQLQKRVTFIPLNKISSSCIDQRTIQHAERMVGKENVQTALSCIKHDPQLTKAMEWVFGNTLICRDLDTAKKVAFDPHVQRRAVTLDGDVVDPAGTLTGGSRAARGSVLAELHALAGAQKRLGMLEAHLAKLEEKLAHLTQNADRYAQLKQQQELKQHELGLVRDRLAQTTHAQLQAEVEQMEAQIVELEETQQKCVSVETEQRGRVTHLEEQMRDQKAVRERELKAAEGEVKACKAKAEATRKAWQERQQEEEQMRLEIADLGTSVQTTEEQIAAAETALAQYAERLTEAETELTEAKAALVEAQKAVKAQKDVMNAQNKEIQAMAAKKDELIGLNRDRELEIKQLDHKLSKARNDAKDAQERVKRMLSEHEWIAADQQFFGQPNTSYDFKATDPVEASKRIGKLEEARSKLGKSINKRAMKMLGKAEEQFNDLMRKKRIVENDKTKIETVIRELDEKKNEALKQAWEQVNRDFGSIFGTLLPGTSAKLQPPDGASVLDGLEVRVAFGGVWKESLAELSGGQRSLVALSLILSLLLFKPAPIYILDEVDAALDLSHTQNIGTMLRTHFQHSQFIVVSLKDGMFNNANVLFKTKFVDGMSTVSRYTQHVPLGSRK